MWFDEAYIIEALPPCLLTRKLQLFIIMQFYSIVLISLLDVYTYFFFDDNKICLFDNGYHLTYNIY